MANTRNVLQITREFHLKRVNGCWITCKQQDDGTWNIHFRADWVPSKDLTGVKNDALFATIENLHDDWVIDVVNHFHDAQTKKD